jgi:hypothetical protein
MAGLEHAQRARGVGHHLAAEFDAGAPLARYDGRWPRIVPDTLHVVDTVDARPRMT